MKQMRLGMIGAENSHSLQIAAMCNIRNVVPMRVTCLWGETRELAEACAKKGEIPEILEDWRSMADKVDGVMIDHRHGKYHARVARYFLEKGLPTFVDKPMTCDSGEAQDLFDLAERRGAPLMTFSAKPLSKGFQRYVGRLRKAGPIRAFHSTGPAELNSPYGGIFFYGIHQVDCAIEVMGTDVREVSVHRLSPADGVATLVFQGGGVATLHLLSGVGVGFRWSALAEGRFWDLADKEDPLFYAKSAKLIHRFLCTGRPPFSRERMLAPIFVLDAMRRSLKAKSSVRVERIETKGGG